MKRGAMPSSTMPRRATAISISTSVSPACRRRSCFMASVPVLRGHDDDASVGPRLDPNLVGRGTADGPAQYVFVGAGGRIGSGHRETSVAAESHRAAGDVGRGVEERRLRGQLELA